MRPHPKPQAKGTLALQKEAAAKQQNGAASSDDDDDSGSDAEPGSSDDDEQRQGGGAQQPGGGGIGQLAIGKGKPPSREELRERLQKKLEVRRGVGRAAAALGGQDECDCAVFRAPASIRLTPGLPCTAHPASQDLRKARKAEEQQKAAEDAKQWRERSLQEGRKKVGKAAAAQQQQRGGKGGKGGDAPAGPQQGQGQQQKGGKRQRGEDDGSALAFNKLDFGSGECMCVAGRAAGGPRPRQLACCWWPAPRHQRVRLPALYCCTAATSAGPAPPARAPQTRGSARSSGARRPSSSCWQRRRARWRRRQAWRPAPRARLRWSGRRGARRCSAPRGTRSLTTRACSRRASKRWGGRRGRGCCALVKLRAG